MKLKVALIGGMHSGKGEVSKILNRDWGCYEIAFADPVKEASVVAINAALDYLGFDTFMTRELLERDKAALRGMPQFIGTDLGRVYLKYPTLWIDLLLDRVQSLEFDHDYARPHEAFGVVVNDCRFPNEASALRREGFKIIRVVRPPSARLKSIRSAIREQNPELSNDQVEEALAKALAHPSETEIEKIEEDTIIVNGGDLARLAREVNLAMDELIKW